MLAKLLMMAVFIVGVVTIDGNITISRTHSQNKAACCHKSKNSFHVIDKFGGYYYFINIWLTPYIFIELIPYIYTREVSILSFRKNSVCVFPLLSATKVYIFLSK